MSSDGPLLGCSEQDETLLGNGYIFDYLKLENGMPEIIQDLLPLEGPSHLQQYLVDHQVRGVSTCPLNWDGELQGAVTLFNNVSECLFACTNSGWTGDNQPSGDWIKAIRA